jgi:hypothetical protein
MTDITPKMDNPSVNNPVAKVRDCVLKFEAEFKNYSEKHEHFQNCENFGLFSKICVKNGRSLNRSWSRSRTKMGRLLNTAILLNIFTTTTFQPTILKPITFFCHCNCFLNYFQNLGDVANLRLDV